MRLKLRPRFVAATRQSAGAARPARVLANGGYLAPPQPLKRRHDASPIHRQVRVGKTLRFASHGVAEFSSLGRQPQVYSRSHEPAPEGRNPTPWVATPWLGCRVELDTWS